MEKELKEKIQEVCSQELYSKDFRERTMTSCPRCDYYSRVTPNKEGYCKCKKCNYYFLDKTVRYKWNLINDE